MQDKHLFEYAIIRVVPRVEREEFLNVGVILFCAKKKFLKCKLHVDAEKLAAMCKALDIQELNKNLNAIETICVGGKHSGPIGQLDLASKFRWLTATRSTVVQSSKVHPGFCDDPELMLERLKEQFVL
jgi:hypothetical protein